MRKLHLLLLLLPAMAYGTNYTSITNGNWETPTTWSPNGTPGFSDNVIINNTVTCTVSFDGCLKLTINSGGVLSNNSGCIFDIINSLTNNSGGTFKGAGNVFFAGPINGTIITGGGDFSSQTGNWFFGGNSAPGTATEIIDASVSIVKNGGNLFLYTSAYSHPVRIINFGRVTLNTGALGNNGTLPCSWTQETGSLLWLVNSSLTNSYDTLVASAPGNNVTYSSIGNFTIIKPFGSTYSTLHFNNGTKTLPSDLIVNGLFQIDAPDAAINFAGHNLTLGNNWINNSTGKLTNFTGTMTFNSASLQTIGGSHSTRFPNVTISGSGGATLATNESFTGALTLSGSGNLAGPGFDTLISTSGATARVAQITGSGVITATFVVQRYDGRTNAQYQSLSSPVQNATLGGWDNQANFWMSGTGGNDGNAMNGPNVYYSVKKYNETTNNFDSINTDAFVLTPGLGIYLWMGTGLLTMSPWTFTTTGVPSHGNVSSNVTFTPGKGNGFNIIGNPYPSPINWSSFQASNASLQSSYYIFEEDNSWHVFSGGSIITMNQGFGIVTSSSTSLTFQENHKSNSDAALLRSGGAGDPSIEANAVTFTLSDDINNFSCPTIISFGPDYSANYNPSEDAIFIKSYVEETPQIYTYSSDNRSMALNRLPDNDTELDVPLTVIGNVAANYTISAKNMNALSSYNCVALVDKSTDFLLNNFEDNASYSFTVSQPGLQKDYILRFKRLPPGENCNSIASSSPISDITKTDNMQIYSTTFGATINFHLAQEENIVISAYSLSGQKLIEDISTNAFDNQLNIALPATIQIYTIRVETPTGVTVKKLYR